MKSTGNALKKESSGGMSQDENLGGVSDII